MGVVFGPEGVGEADEGVDELEFFQPFGEVDGYGAVAPEDVRDNAICEVEALDEMERRRDGRRGVRVVAAGEILARVPVAAVVPGDGTVGLVNDRRK